MKTTTLPLLSLLLAASLISREAAAATQPATNETAAAATALSADESDTPETAPAKDTSPAKIQPGPAFINGNNVNVRAQPTINSEVVTQLQDGEAVTVNEAIIQTDNQGNDPARWAKISYPKSTSAWVHSLYVDPETMTVKPRKLNVRSGPGENFTVVGQLKAGDQLTQTGSSGDWLSIQPPENATAYVAAKLLRQEIELPVTIPEATSEIVYAPEVVQSDTEIITTNEPVEMESSTMETPTEVMTIPENAWGTNGQTAASTSTNDLAPLPLGTNAPVEAVVEEPPPPRIVSREGIVRSFTSIQAPSDYKLVSLRNGKTINYLYTTSTNLDLSRYVGLHIIVSGQEWLDKRWTNTPVLTLQKIYLVD